MPEPQNTDTRTTLRNLVTAIIAVNNYPIHKALELTTLDKPLGWVNSAMAHGPTTTAFDIKTEIMDSGYDRGDYVALLLGQRIRSCLDHISEQGFSDFLALISESRDSALRELPKLPGVGPKVTSNFIQLQFGSSPGLSSHV